MSVNLNTSHVEGTGSALPIDRKIAGKDDNLGIKLEKFKKIGVDSIRLESKKALDDILLSPDPKVKGKQEAIKKLAGMQGEGTLSEAQYKKIQNDFAAFLMDVKNFEAGKAEGSITWEEYAAFTVSDKPNTRFSKNSWDGIAGDTKDGKVDANENTELSFSEFITAQKMVSGYNEYLMTGKTYQQFTSFVEVDAGKIEEQFQEIAAGDPVKQQAVINELVRSFDQQPELKSSATRISSAAIENREKFLLLFLLKGREMKQEFTSGQFEQAKVHNRMSEMFGRAVAKGPETKRPEPVMAAKVDPNQTSLDDAKLKAIEQAAGIDFTNPESYENAQYEKIELSKLSEVATEFNNENISSVDGFNYAVRIFALAGTASNKEASDGVAFIKLQIVFLKNVIEYLNQKASKTVKNKQISEQMAGQLIAVQHNLKVKISNLVNKDVSKIEGFIISEKGWNFDGDLTKAIASLEKLKTNNYGDDALSQPIIQKYIDTLGKNKPKPKVAKAAPAKKPDLVPVVYQQLQGFYPLVGQGKYQEAHDLMFDIRKKLNVVSKDKKAVKKLYDQLAANPQLVSVVLRGINKKYPQITESNVLEVISASLGFAEGWINKNLKKEIASK